MIEVNIFNPLLQTYASEGRFTFTSSLAGEHLICLHANSTAWFGGSQLVSPFQGVICQAARKFLEFSNQCHGLTNVFNYLFYFLEGRVRRIWKMKNWQHAVWIYGREEHDRQILFSKFVISAGEIKYLEKKKDLAKKKDVWMGFVDLEKTFDRPWWMVWWTLRFLSGHR